MTSLLRFISVLLPLAAIGELRAAQADPVTVDWIEYSGKNPQPIKAGRGEYQNPILSGFYPDPSICRVGDEYYLVNSTFGYFPGIPIFHSLDMVNWKQIGNVIHRPEQLKYENLRVNRAIYAPAISHHDGLFYVICTQVSGEGNFLVTAQSPAGPWSDPVLLDFPCIDPSLFFDDDGRAWVVNNDKPDGPGLYDKQRTIKIQEYDIKARKMIGPRKIIVNGGADISTKPVWIEGPHLYKRNGWYYLMAAEGGTGPGHSEVIFRSKNVDGPYESWDQNPILTQRDLPADVPDAVTCTGHADLVIGPDNKWWAVFLGVRPYQERFSPMGRETFMLPVEWTDDGWPRILPQKTRVPLIVKSPLGASLTSSPDALWTGDFTWRDDFKTDLSLQWIMLRAPKETWWSVDKTAGLLKLTPRTDLLTGSSNPSYLARRIQHQNFTVTTALTIPAEKGISAGLALFQNENQHYYFAVHRQDSGLTLYLEQTKGSEGQPERGEIAAIPLPAEAKALRLRISAVEDKCSFEYATTPDSWNVLAKDQNAKVATSAYAGGFVGATTGLHVRIDP